MKQIMSESKQIRDISRCIRRKMRFVFTNKFGPMKLQESICSLKPSANLMLLFSRQLSLILKPMNSYDASKQRQYKFMKSLLGPSPEQLAPNKPQSFAFTEKRGEHTLEWDTCSYHCIPYGVSFHLVERIHKRLWCYSVTVTELEPALARAWSLFTDTSNHWVGPFNVAGEFCKELA